MTISSSLNAGVAGLTANASRLAAISDNIANSSTYGYRRAETEFHALVATPNGAASYSAGGVRVSTQRLVSQGGPIVSSTNATDLAVRGDGFLPVASATQVEAGNGTPQMLLTSTGSFRPDSNGYLRSESGLMLMGFPADRDGNIPPYPRDTSDALEPVRLNKTQLQGEPTTEMTLGINLPATGTAVGADGASHATSVEYQDNIGQSESIQISFTPTVPVAGNANSNEWTMVLTDSAQNGAVIGEYTVTFQDGRGASRGTIDSVTTLSGGTFDASTGNLIVDVASGPIEINIGVPGQPGGLTQLSDRFAPLNIAKNGTPVGTMASVEVDEKGFVHAFFDTGVTRTIFQIPLVNLPNPNGMIPMDNQTFMPSLNSGSYFLWNAGEGPTGEVLAFSREESATDVAGELTDMITTQRAYSSNAKVIQTVDEMLQETTNIKR
ncbi:MAG: flagellar hook-basal body complex protein [Rhodobacteraceae bacterium]|nr:flagellar hook-basal body complex protein [Paracoccaceae bacterium]